MGKPRSIRTRARIAANAAIPDVADLGPFTAIQRMKHWGYMNGWEAGYRQAVADSKRRASNSGAGNAE